jgi:hypothetical protein
VAGGEVPPSAIATQKRCALFGVPDAPYEAKQAQPLCTKAEVGKSLVSHLAKNIELAWPRERFESHRLALIRASPSN